MTAQKQLEVEYVTRDECERLHEAYTHDCDVKQEAIQREIDMRYEESLRDRAGIKETVKEIKKELQDTRRWAITTFIAVILGMGAFITYTVANGGFATNREMAEVKAEVKMIAIQQAHMAKVLEEVRQDQIRKYKND